MFEKMLITLQILRGDFAARLLDDEDGATMVEYGLLVVFIALVAVVGATALGISLSGMFSGIATDLN
jgi:pilus assembly protein Flp/PilA